MRKVDNIFLDNLPTIDLHGYDRDMARVMTNDFVMDNVLLNNDKIVIIHGIGTGIVKNSVHEALMKNRYVEKYQLDNFNTGCTIVWLKKN